MKYKDKGNRIVIAILIIIIIIIGFIGAKLLISLNSEKKLETEVKEIKKYIAENNINTDQIKNYQNEDLTKGDLLIVENAIEEYSYDLAVSLKSINDILNDKTLTTLLSTKNYIEDSPGFLKSKSYIKETKEKLNETKNSLLSLTKEETIESYIKDKKLSNYNKRFYISLAEGETLSAKDAKNFENAIDKVISLLDNSNELFDLLIKTQGSWYVLENEVIFTNQTDLNQYMEIVKKIKGQI